MTYPFSDGKNCVIVFNNPNSIIRRFVIDIVILQKTLCKCVGVEFQVLEHFCDHFWSAELQDLNEVYI